MSTNKENGEVKLLPSPARCPATFDYKNRPWTTDSTFPRQETVFQCLPDGRIMGIYTIKRANQDKC